MTTNLSIKSFNTYNQKIASNSTTLPWVSFRKGWKIQLLPTLRKDQRVYGVVSHFKIQSDQSPCVLKVTLSFKKGISHKAYWSIYNISKDKLECENIEMNNTDKLYHMICWAFGEYSITKVGSFRDDRSIGNL
jgi:hypothetical protein